MAKIIKFPLEMANGTKVRTLEDLKEHYDIASVIKYYKDGRLLRWLKANYEDEITEKLQESEKQSLKNIFSVLDLPEPSDEDLKNADLRNISASKNFEATEDDNLKVGIKKHFKDASLLEDWNIFQNESDTKDKCVVEFENEKLQTFTGKFFEKGENFEKDVADFLKKLINIHRKTTDEIGDIAYSDGSVSKDYNSSKTPVGIVIEVKDGFATKIVSLTKTRADWNDAKRWCDDYTDASGNREWYLPTKDELNQLYLVKGYVNTTIEKIIDGGGTATKLGSGYYWSSSQYNNGSSWCQRFSVGGQYYGNKDDTESVRAVRDF